MTDPKRHPAGAPASTGGRFAPEVSPAAAAALTADQPATADEIERVRATFAKHFPDAAYVGLNADFEEGWLTTSANLYDADGALTHELQLHFDRLRSPEVDDELEAAIGLLETRDDVADDRLGDALPGTTDDAVIRLAPPECSESGCDEPAERGRDGLCNDCADDLLCRGCGDRNDDGQGWDGLCGSCADREEAARTCSRCDADLDEPTSDGLCEECSADAEAKVCRGCRQSADHLSANDLCDGCADEVHSVEAQR